MIDPVSLTIAITSAIIGILSHIRHSSCFGIDIDTRTPPSTPAIVKTESTELLKEKKIKNIL